MEVVCIDLLRTLGALASEFHLPLNIWPTLLPLVQYDLNNKRLTRLGKVAPIAEFSGLPAQDAQRIIKEKVGGEARLINEDEVSHNRREEITKLWLELE